MPPDRGAWEAEFREIVAGRIPPFRVELDEIKPRPFHLEGGINARNLRDITLGFDPRWRWDSDHDLRDYCAGKGIDEPIHTALEFILHHEMGHGELCPGTPAMGDELHRAVWEELESVGKAAFTGFVVNYLADILVNTQLVRHGRPPEGIVTDWRDQAMVSLRRHRLLELLGLRKKAQRAFHDYFVVFILVQLSLFADPASSQLLDPFLNATPEITEAVRQLREYFANTAITEDTAMWKNLFSRGARIIAPFLPDQVPLQMTSSPHPFLNPRNPEEARRRSSPTWYDEEREEVVPMPDRILLPEGTTCPVPTGRWGRVPRNPGGGRCQTRGEGVAEAVPLPPHLAGRFRAFDFYYRSQAKDVAVRAKPRVPKPTQTALLNLMPTEAALKIVESSAQRLNHVALTIDVSPSMLAGGEPFEVAGVKATWGSDSAYHHALVTLYRLVKWFEHEHPEGLLNVLTFSARTYSTGWFEPAGFFDRAASMLFSPSGWGTFLDVSVLKREMIAQPGALLFVLTDGAIFNWRRVVGAFLELAPVALPVIINIGPHNAFSLECRAEGFPVHANVQANSLAEIVLKETREHVSAN